MTDAVRESRPKPNRFTRSFCTLSVLAFAAMNCAGLIGALHPLFDYFSHFQVHLLLAGMSLVLACALTRSRALVAIALLGCIIPLARIAPLWQGEINITPVGRMVDLRVMSVNVLTINTNHQDLIDEVREHDPDILALFEVSEQWASAIQPLIDAYPYVHRTSLPGDRWYGVQILSRHELDPLALPTSFAVESFRCAAAEVTTDAGQILLVAAHPMPPVGFSSTRLRDRQLALVNTYLKKHGSAPAIVLGDLNSTPWSHGYRTLTSGTGLKNARDGAGVQGSWFAALPGFLRIPIDHILVSSGFDVRTSAVGADIGSDHLPVIADIALPVPQD